MSDTTMNPAGAEPAAQPEPTLAGPPAQPEPAAQPGPAAPEPAVHAPAEPGPAGRRAGFAVRAAASVAAAALLGVGIGLGILEVGFDDSPAPAAATAQPSGAPTASAGPAFGAQQNGTHFGSMRDLLLPVPAGFRLGADSGAFGNDTELTEAQRKAWVEDEVRGLPAKLQDAVRKAWQEIPLKGGGVRSFAAEDGSMQATVWLLQYHQAAVKAHDAWVAALGSDSGLFRVGPPIPGHPEAHCYLPDLAPGAEIDELECSAALGDLRVVLHVEGIAPLPKDRIVPLFAQQLDRLAIPGASA
ncbi:hypothetical protein [Kitasatospora sp. NPDC051914]|uniref:hypothetical protein n=1 Tax=Kitasatospora sp. NPDC051914 TaxID=3154945 RepID=UPI003447C0D3